MGWCHHSLMNPIVNELMTLLHSMLYQTSDLTSIPIVQTLWHASLTGSSVLTLLFLLIQVYMHWHQQTGTIWPILGKVVLITTLNVESLHLISLAIELNNLLAAQLAKTPFPLMQTSLPNVISNWVALIVFFIPYLLSVLTLVLFYWFRLAKLMLLIVLAPWWLTLCLATIGYAPLQRFLSEMLITLFSQYIGLLTLLLISGLTGLIPIPGPFLTSTLSAIALMVILMRLPLFLRLTSIW